MKKNNSVISEMRRLEFMASYLWPVLRILIKSRLASRCKNCISSELYTELSNGICSECRDINVEGEIDQSKEDPQLMQKQMHEIFKKYSGSGRKNYDALLLFSGGKDSTYLLHKLKNEYANLRILAFTVDNNFMSPIAIDNANEIIDKLNVKHFVFKPSFSFSKQMFRYALTHLGAEGCSSTVDQFDGDSIFDIARNYAAKEEIPLVIGGISPYQVENNIGIQWFETSVDEESKKREIIANHRLEEIFDDKDMTYWWDGTNWPLDSIPRVLFPFYAWGYDETEIKKEVNRLKLISEKNNSPLVTNNQLIPLMSLVDNATIGYSSFEPEFSRLVREGKAEKNKWRNLFEMAEYSAKSGKFIKKSIDDVLEKLSLSRVDVGL